MDAEKIKNALTLLHHYEKTEGREAAFKRAVRMAMLNEAEAAVLARSVNL